MKELREKIKNLLYLRPQTLEEAEQQEKGIFDFIEQLLLERDKEVREESYQKGFSDCLKMSQCQCKSCISQRLKCSADKHKST